MTTITAAVAKRGLDSCPLGGLGGGVEAPFRIGMSKGWLELDVGVKTQVPLAGLNQCTDTWWRQSPLSHICDWRMGKGDGDKGQEDKSHLWSTHNEPGIT